MERFAGLNIRSISPMKIIVEILSWCIGHQCLLLTNSWENFCGKLKNHESLAQRIFPVYGMYEVTIFVTKRHTDGQTHTSTHIHTRTHIHMHRQTDRQTDRQTHTHTHTHKHNVHKHKDMYIIKYKRWVFT